MFRSDLNWTRWVGRRYLRAKRDTRFLSMSTLLSMIGIGLGVAALIVVLSVMNGFENQLRNKLISTDLHILMTPSSTFAGFEMGRIPTAELSKVPGLVALRSNKEVSHFSEVLGTELILRIGSKVAGVLIKGVDDDRIARLKPQIVEEAMPNMLFDRDEGTDAIRFPGLIIGRELAYELGIIPGDFVTAISPTLMDGPFSNIPRMKRFVIEGIYQNGVSEQEAHEVFTSITHMESFLKRRGYVSQIEVTLKDGNNAASLIGPFRSQLEGLKIRDWTELNGHLFASMKLERIAMFLILIFTVVIASLNIVSTQTLMVQEKVKEIAILKTLGAQRKQVTQIYLWNGLWIGGLGVLWGTIIGVLICLLLGNTEIILLPEVYQDRTLPVSFDPVYFIGVPLSSFLIVLLASIFPARKAAALTPLEGFRS